MPTRQSENPIAPVGESIVRLDAREKVTGSALYADDFQFGPNLLHARVVRSPHPMALIKKVDTSEAEAMPGVKGNRHREGFRRYAWALPDRPIHPMPRPRSLCG